MPASEIQASSRGEPRSRGLPGSVWLHFAAAGALFAGGWVYLLWRPPSLLMFEWVAWAGLSGKLQLLREAVSGAVPPAWIVYSFPHAAWTFAGTVFLAALWSGSKDPLRRLWIAAVPALSILGELGQLAGVVPGRFDPLDLATAASASALALLLANAANLLR